MRILLAVLCLLILAVAASAAPVQDMLAVSEPAQDMLSCPCDCPCVNGGVCDCGANCLCDNCPAQAKAPNPTGYTHGYATHYKHGYYTYGSQGWTWTWGNSTPVPSQQNFGVYSNPSFRYITAPVMSNGFSGGQFFSGAGANCST